MRLDRYEDPANFPTAPRYKVQRRQADGSYVDVDPEECFVLKRRDRLSVPALAAYAKNAAINGDSELGKDVARLCREWEAASERRMPD